MEPDTALYVGIGLIPLAGLLALGLRSCARRLHTVLETPTIACRDLPGLGASTVEVKGVTRAAQPLLSDLARVPCVAFACSITEHWTTTEHVTDSKGRTRTVTRHHSAVRYANDQRIPFEVVDDSGSATIEPEGAEIELIPHDAGPAPPDSPAHDVAAQHWNGRLTYEESALPLAQRVYVLASVSERHTLVRPPTLADPFLITHRSEQQLVRAARWGVRLFGFFAAAAFLAGMGMLGYWFQYRAAAAPG